MADDVDERTARLRDRLKWFLFFRVLIVSCFLGALALVYLREPNQRYAVSVSILLFAIAATYALTIVSAFFLLRLKQISGFAYLQLVFDILLTTGVIFVTGGGDSPFGFLYSLVVINAAVLMSTAGAIVAASLRTSRTSGTLEGWPPFLQCDTSMSNPRTVAGVAQDDHIGDRTKTEHRQRFAVGGPTEILDSLRIIKVRQLVPF